MGDRSNDLNGKRYNLPSEDKAFSAKVQSLPLVSSLADRPPARALAVKSEDEGGSGELEPTRFEDEERKRAGLLRLSGDEVSHVLTQRSEVQ